MDILVQLATGFGLAAPAGFNAYLPLLIVAVAARFGGLVTLNPTYDFLTSWWAIGIMAFLLAIEVFADKIPAVDTANDLVQTAVRPAAGAILFAASTGIVTDIHPAVALASGLLAAGGVHALKATARPVITATTAGIANPLVSFAEDGLAAGTVLIALFAPILAATLFALVIAGIIVVVWRLRGRRKRRL